MSACLGQYFGGIADPRVEHTRAYQLLDIIAIALFAVLAGADSWVAIETYGNVKRAWLETLLVLPHGIPYYDRDGGVKALQIVSAWAREHRLVLGQCAVESKSNEIVAVVPFLKGWRIIGQF